MTVTLNQLSDFGYKMVNGEYFLEFGAAGEDLNITNVWHKMTGVISGNSSILTIDPVTTAPVGSNFRYRIETPFNSAGNENQPLFRLKIQNDINGNPSLYAFIGTEDHEITRTVFAGTDIEISDLNNIFFTVENNTFKFYYFPTS